MRTSSAALVLLPLLLFTLRSFAVFALWPFSASRLLSALCDDEGFWASRHWSSLSFCSSLLFGFCSLPSRFLFFSFHYFSFLPLFLSFLPSPPCLICLLFLLFPFGLTFPFASLLFAFPSFSSLSSASSLPFFSTVPSLLFPFLSFWSLTLSGGGGCCVTRRYLVRSCRTITSRSSAARGRLAASAYERLVKVFLPPFFFLLRSPAFALKTFW